MALFLNLGTRMKLLLGFGLMIVLMAMVSVITYRDTMHLKASQTALFQDDLSIAYNLMALRHSLNRERADRLALALDDQAEQPNLLQALDRDIANIAAIMDKLHAGRKNDPEFAQKLDNIDRAHLALSTIRDRDVLPLLKSGKRNEAAAAIRGTMGDSFQALRTIADREGDQQFAEAEARMRNAEAVVENAQATLVSANIAAVLIGLLLVFLLDRIIAMPLKQATTVAQKISTGDLTVRVPAGGREDEVGQLLRALNDMVVAWKQSMSEANAGIATLSAAAGEILAGAMQVSAGASETAAAVSETTATVEEVKQTALLTTQKARTVSDAAQKAAQTAETGRKAIEDGMEGMESIQQQIESIAETIVRLSERSQAIAEITATVSGLAEQSNLLAVNAAIEAAKAGEQGKGFSVVAREVKDLADQSKQATKQVRLILSDIQKAISTAVMTTEQGTRTVAGGVQQTTAAGNAIRMLSESIADAAEAAVQIAASSQQQLAGMDQVALAMENIKQVSAENAAGCKQSEASAQNLHQLGQQLKQMSERFRV